jgi:CTP:molybdopterin cytidylyltransferase MocA
LPKEANVPHPSRFAVIIIAAGYSSRMNDFKPLLTFFDQSALARLVQTYQESNVPEIYVVTGHRSVEIQQALQGSKVHFVYNEAYDDGMFGSIQKGLHVMSEAIDAFFVQPVDIPLIKPSTIACLMEAYARERKGVLYPTFLGKKGHPPLIDTKYKAAICKSQGEGGLKKVLEAFFEDALCVRVCDQAVLMDMDTPEDYRRLLNYEASTAPTREECLAMMLQSEVPEHIIRHCEAVEKKALELYQRVAAFGVNVDPQMLSAAALLHDIARQEKNHARIGAEKIRAMGYGIIGDMIETHMDIDVDATAPLNAGELLFLADKMVGETSDLGLEKRFEKAMEKCNGNEEALKNLHCRFESARRILQKIETVSQESLHVD